ncbi:MAG: hypothetical protein NZ740_05455 [Kiritimatiellae bacterium]|nr:hypothetical protein [Kiritimatiellia bacterium]MDW8458540.1 hypothetical protein [Verrucomicrobiota bacterium]
MKKMQLVLLLGACLSIQAHSQEIWFVGTGRDARIGSTCRYQARYGAVPARVYVPGHWTIVERPNGSCYRKWQPGRWVDVERRPWVCRCQPVCVSLIDEPRFSRRSCR